MKIIIAGSRGITDIKHVNEAMIASTATFHWLDTPIDEIVSGTAPGVDRLGEQWARSRAIPVKRIPAQWDEYGRSAGHIRNAIMAEYADGAVIVWDGESRGTVNMANQMRQRNKPLYIYVVEV